MDDDLTDVERRVAANSAAFRRDLPRLLREHAGRWVIYAEERLQAHCADEDEAISLAQGLCGHGAGYAIHHVTPDAADPIHFTRLGSAGAWVVVQQYRELAAAATAYLDAEDAEPYRDPAAGRAAVADALARLEVLLGRRKEDRGVGHNE